MKKTLIAVTAFLFVAVSAPGAYADLDHFMGVLNAQAIQIRVALTRNCAASSMSLCPRSAQS